MKLTVSYGVNEKGHFTAGEVDVVELAKEYGTPLYVLNEDDIRKHCRRFKEAIDECYDGNGLPLYASKAFSCKEMYRIINDEGLGADVVSGGELYTALSAGFPAEKIFFHGNNKTADELDYAMKSGVGRIVVDNIRELSMLDAAAARYGRVAKILFRIKPGVDAHTHDFIKTGQIDSKFGFAIETGEAIGAVKAALDYKNIELCGMHCHIGSQIFDTAPFHEAANVMMGFLLEIKQKFGKEMAELNLGGGFGIRYKENDTPVTYREYIVGVSKIIKAFCAENDYKVPRIYVEPGRGIAAPGSMTLYTVGSVKTIPDVRTYVAVDGGMPDNPRYILYGAEYEAVIANKADKPRDFVATIAGKCCESGDLLAENAMIQRPEPDDILAVLATGAYNYSMASNYNRIPRPAVVMVKGNGARVVVKRESFEDLIKNDL